MKSKLKNDEAYYVPLLESLQNLLNNDAVLEEVQYNQLI
jgi:hypothetical protein